MKFWLGITILIIVPCGVAAGMITGFLIGGAIFESPDSGALVGSAASFLALTAETIYLALL